MPDGLKVDDEGIVFATGPGGIWIFDAAGQSLGRIKIGQLVSNVSLSGDGNILFVTADDNLLKLKIK